jgi:hypothetical protein
MQHMADIIALLMSIHQAGYNMIPQWGWRQAIDAYLIDKLSRFVK